MDLGFYLGYPLKPTYKNSDFNFILNKMDKNFKVGNLTFCKKIGRTQLITSTITNLSSHIMKTLLLPKSILTKIDSKTRNFFWGHTNNVRKVHTLS